MGFRTPPGDPDDRVHGGATGLAGGHSHGGVTCPGDPPIHSHDLSEDEHARTITVEATFEETQFTWIACGR
jgi:hypothetical protein